ncbi:MAG: ACP S-malonyltransferase [Actinomycetota bacterium]
MHADAHRLPRVGLLFPGQGSQYPGMADPWLSHPAGRAVLDEASETLGEDLVSVCRDEARLDDTALVQPAIVACDVAAYRVVRERGIVPVAAAGHSVGEYAALVASGAVPLRAAIEAVVERGRAMADAARETPGAMTALIGLDADQAKTVAGVAGRGGVLTVANLNSPTQIVLAGTVPAVEQAEAMARSRGAKAVRLRVAGAFHSPLMRPALPRVRAAVSRMPFSAPEFPVIPNGSGAPEENPAALQHHLSRHVGSAVRWAASMRSMAALDVDVFVEAGPGQVLAKLVKRCVPGAAAMAIGSPEQAETLAASQPASSEDRDAG